MISKAYVEQLTRTQAAYFALQDSKRKRRPKADPDYVEYIVVNEYWENRGVAFDWAVKFRDAVFRFATQDAATEAAVKLARERAKPYPRPPKTWIAGNHIGAPTGQEYITPPSWILDFPGYRWAKMRRERSARGYSGRMRTIERDEWDYYKVYESAAKARIAAADSEMILITKKVATELRDQRIADGIGLQFWAGEILDYELSEFRVYAMALEVWFGNELGWVCQVSRIPTAVVGTEISLDWAKAKGETGYTSTWPDGTPCRVYKDGSRWRLEINGRYVYRRVKSKFNTRKYWCAAAHEEWSQSVLETYRRPLGKCKLAWFDDDAA